MSAVAGLARLAGVSLGTAAVLAVAGELPLPHVDLTTRAERPVAGQAPATRAAGATELVCPGPETIGVRGSRVARVLPAASLLTVAAAPPGPGAGPSPAGGLTAQSLPAGPGVVLAAGPDPRHQRGTLRGAAAVVVRGTGGLAPGLTAEQTSLVPKGDLRGLTSIACSAASADTWLVGGGGEEGRRGRLVLANPAATAVEVRIDVLSATGPVARTPGSAVAVPAHSRVVLLLDALAPGVRSPVVHVRATGGAVAATLHDARLAGTTAKGTDDVAPGAVPARRVLVPGLTVNGRAVLRLGAPGAAEAVAEVRLLGPSGPVDPPGGPVVRVPAGGTLDVDLTGLAPGSYGALVTADVPVVAGAMVERSSKDDGPADLAWLASTRPLTTLTGLPVVRSTAPWSTTVELTAPAGDATVDLTTVTADGAQQLRTLRVPAGTSTVTVLPAAQSAWLHVVSGSGPVVAARTTTYVDGVGRLITAGSLADLPTTEVVPVVRPAG